MSQTHHNIFISTYISAPIGNQSTHANKHRETHNYEAFVSISLDLYRLLLINEYILKQKHHHFYDLQVYVDNTV